MDAPIGSVKISNVPITTTADVVPCCVSAKPPAKEIPARAVDLTTITIPEYFEHAIPVATKSVYDVLGIKFVTVIAGNKTYYIYSACLPDVVARLGLYV